MQPQDAVGDYDGARVLRYHVAYRALVRAKVAALRRAQVRREGAPRGAIAADPVDTYLDVARACIAPGARTLFIAHGLSGSGKTAWTGQLLEAIGAVRIRANVERPSSKPSRASRRVRWRTSLACASSSWPSQAPGRVLVSAQVTP